LVKKPMALVALSCASSASKSSVSGAGGAVGATTGGGVAGARGATTRGAGGGVAGATGVATGGGVAGGGVLGATGVAAGCGAGGTVVGVTGVATGCGAAACVATTSGWGCEARGSGGTLAQPAVNSNSRTAAYLANQSRPVIMRTSRITMTSVRPALGATPQLRLCGHAGIAPSSISTRMTIRMVII
jgi:hypothetical protein